MLRSALRSQFGYFFVIPEFMHQEEFRQMRHSALKACLHITVPYGAYGVVPRKPV